MNIQTNTETIYDSSGFAVFSHGDRGAVHVMAHRLLDGNRIALGHRLLGEWLDNRTGSGSDWAHLQFHMCLFELSLGRRDSAYNRFTLHVLPTVARQEALTDAPALLWRFALTACYPIELPWNVVRSTALVQLQKSGADPYVELHQLLALAGAGDFISIDSWLERQSPASRDDSKQVVREMAIALRCFATGAFREAAMRLDVLAPKIPAIGGSRAQNELFYEIAKAAWARAGYNLVAAA